jgi:4-alpha-glucanotransferase
LKKGHLQAYANSKGVKIVGDIPIYVGGQSADVWAYQGLFELGKGSQPLMVSGVPPDAFSDTGQLWGSPLYDWKVCSRICYVKAMHSLGDLKQCLNAEVFSVIRQ